MKNVKGVTSTIGSAVHAAKRAADIMTALQSGSALDQPVTVQVEAVLSRYGEKRPRVSRKECTRLRAAAKELHCVFAAANKADAAVQLNHLLRKYCSPPRLTAHGNSPWHLHLDSRDNSPWAEWFITSSAFALAILLAEKQRKPGSICASKTCNNPFVDLGKGGGRSYCSPRCATRERVANYRRNT